MTCPDNAQLHRYHDRQLSAQQTALIESHVRACEVCRDELLLLRRVSEAVSQSRLAVPNEQMLQRWTRSIAQQRDRQLRHLAEWAMAAAAAIVLGIFGLWPSMDTAQAEPLLGNIEQAMLVNPGEEALPANLVTARMFAADLASNTPSTDVTPGSKAQ